MSFFLLHDTRRATIIIFKSLCEFSRIRGKTATRQRNKISVVKTTKSPIFPQTLEPMPSNRDWLFPSFVINLLIFINPKSIRTAYIRNENHSKPQIIKSMERQGRTTKNSIQRVCRSKMLRAELEQVKKMNFIFEWIRHRNQIIKD